MYGKYASDAFSFRVLQVQFQRICDTILLFMTTVMGAGKADPESVSKDVIFPNYEWPELGKVQQQWNVTTFLVLSQKVIKSMDAGK